MNEALRDVPRRQAKKIIETERRRRRAGNWGEWEMLDMPNGLPSRTGGWLLQIRRAYRNLVFSVLVRPGDGFVHLGIISLSGDRPSWPEAQRIKDEIAGPDAFAVEIYPRAQDVVDEADMYHLWVLPKPLPFGLHGEEA